MMGCTELSIMKIHTRIENLRCSKELEPHRGIKMTEMNALLLLLSTWGWGVISAKISFQSPISELSEGLQ